MSSFWAVVPLLFFANADEIARIVIVCIVIGMVCGGAFALSSVPAAATAFAAPITLGSIAALAQHDVQSGLLLFVLLAIFNFVIFRSTQTMGSALVEWLLGEFELEKQRDMIGILLGEFEENSNDWMWETDAQFRLTYVSQGLLVATRRAPSETFGRRFVDILFGHGPLADPVQAAARNQILEHFARHLPFREIECPLQIGGRSRWWSFAAR
ncbi:MAG: hypothetical protein FJX29_10935, partial [Alphaproteobacteria bacterium]|nr:hypothetical protein [Alphaproteobacteria bacterium]